MCLFQELCQFGKYRELTKKIKSLISSARYVLTFLMLRPEHAGRNNDDVIKWKHFPRYWPFVWGIHRWIPLTKASDSGLWCFSLIFAWTNGWKPGDLRRHCACSLWRHCNVVQYQDRWCSCIVNSSSAVSLSMLEKRVLVFRQKVFLRPAISQYWKIMDDAIMFFFIQIELILI